MQMETFLSAPTLLPAKRCMVWPDKGKGRSEGGEKLRAPDQDSTSLRCAHTSTLENYPSVCVGVRRNFPEPGAELELHLSYSPPDR